MNLIKFQFCVKHEHQLTVDMVMSLCMRDFAAVVLRHSSTCSIT